MPTHSTLQPWGWTSYRRTGWARPNGTREYRAHFESHLPTGEIERCTLTFWAHRPILAIRHIIQQATSAESILRLHGQTLN